MIVLTLFYTTGQVIAIRQILSSVVGPKNWWDNDPAGNLSGVRAERLGYDGIQTHCIMLTMPFQRAQWQVTEWGFR